MQREEKNTMGKTRDLFKKIRDIKGTFHAKMGSTKDRNGMDLTEAEDIKKWQEHIEELYKKDLYDPDNHNGCDHSPRARHPRMQSQEGLINSCEKKRSKKQRRKGKIYSSECRVPKNSKER